MHLGISQATVSYVLSERETGAKVGAETRGRVLRAASELGYSRNEMARAMKSGKSRLLGFVMPEASSDADAALEYQSLVMSGAAEEAAARGYALKILQWDDVTTTVHRCLEWRLIGVATVSLHHDHLQELTDAAQKHDLPVAVIDGSPARFWALHLETNNDHGLRAAFDHLRALGHQRIAYLTGGEDETAQWRASLWQKMATQAGVEVLCESGAWWDRATNETAALRLLSSAQRPTAVVCCGDSSAFSTIKIARRLGLRVPQELSVVGYGGYTFAEFCDPALTTVAQPFRALGRAAIDLLLDDSPLSKGEIRHRTLSPELVIRDSAAPVIES